MPTIQEALHAAGLTPHVHATKQNVHQVPTRILNAPASHMARAQNAPGLYEGRPVNYDKFTDDWSAISCGPATPDTDGRIYDRAGRDVTGMEYDRESRTYVERCSPRVKQDRARFTLMDESTADFIREHMTCGTCHLMVPAGHDTCPDC